MKTRIAALLLMVGLCTQAVGTTPEARLHASDVIRNPGQSFTMTSTITEYIDGQAGEPLVVQIFARPDEPAGQFQSLVRFQLPRRDQGKIMLRRGQDLWFYDPAGRASIRISPQQRLLGQASNGDVVTANLAGDYRIESMHAETILDGHRQTRQTQKLVLHGITAAVPYPRVEYWLDDSSNQPLKAHFYAASGQMLKIAYFRNVQFVMGAERPTETLIIDVVDPRKITRMAYRDHRLMELPQPWFQRGFLPRFNEVMP